MPCARKIQVALTLPGLCIRPCRLGFSYKNCVLFSSLQRTWEELLDQVLDSVSLQLSNSYSSSLTHACCYGNKRCLEKIKLMQRTDVTCSLLLNQSKVHNTRQLRKEATSVTLLSKQCKKMIDTGVLILPATGFSWNSSKWQREKKISLASPG